MCRVLNVSVERRFVLELHYAAEGVALSSRRNVRAYVSLKKSGNLSLESSDLSRRFFLLSFRCIWLPLKCEYVEDSSCGVFRGSDRGQADSRE